MAKKTMAYFQIAINMGSASYFWQSKPLLRLYIHSNFTDTILISIQISMQSVDAVKECSEEFLQKSD